MKACKRYQNEKIAKILASLLQGQGQGQGQGNKIWFKSRPRPDYHHWSVYTAAEFSELHDHLANLEIHA